LLPVVLHVLQKHVLIQVLKQDLLLHLQIAMIG
jgi:hypothetical protein